MNDFTLLQFLKERKSQLEGRLVSINHYFNSKGKSLGKVKFNKQDLVIAQHRIDECMATIEFLNQYHKSQNSEKLKKFIEKV